MTCLVASWGETTSEVVYALGSACTIRCIRQPDMTYRTMYIGLSYEYAADIAMALNEQSDYAFAYCNDGNNCNAKFTCESL